MQKAILHAALATALLPMPALAQNLDWTPEDTVRVETAINDGQYGTVTSVHVRYNGRIVMDSFFNGADALTLHDTRSATKTITGMGVGLAIADGATSLDASVARFFSDVAPFENPDARKDQITFEDLLTMSGPLECNDWSQMSRGNEERMYNVEDWYSFFWNLPIRGFPSWQTPPDRSEYGRAFSYCTAGVQIAGVAAGRAVGQDLDAFIQDRLFAQLGIDTFEWPRNGLGDAHLGGGLRLTTDGLARFAELQLNLGVHEGRQILPEDWVRASAEPRAVIEEAPDGWRYGYLWWLVPYQVDGQTFYAQMMNGNGGNRVVVLPEFQATYVFTNTDYNTPTMHQNAANFFQNEIVARLSLGN